MDECLSIMRFKAEDMIFQNFDFEIESIHFAIDLEKRMVAEVISQPEQPVNVELIKSYLNKERMMSAISEENNESLATSSCRKSLESTEYSRKLNLSSQN